jgi:hypothetical protein
MDDFVVIHKDKKYLKNLLADIDAYIVVMSRADKQLSKQGGNMKTPKYDPASDVIQVLESTIRIATPRNTVRGRRDRDKLVRQVIVACKGMMYDKRVRKPK